MIENLNTTMNETQLSPSSCLTPGTGNTTAERIAKTIAYCLIFVVSLAGNTSIGIIVYKTKTMRKSINFLIVNMAMSDLLFPVFAIPWILTELHFSSWPISGPLGQALCKLRSFLLDVSVAVSIQSLVLIALDRFGAVVFPFRSPLISSKLCPYFIFTTWITAIILFFPILIAYTLVEHQERLACEMRWQEAFGKTSNIRDLFFVLLILLYLIPFTVIMILYTGILLKHKLQKHVGEPSTNAEKQRVKRHRNVLKMAIAIVLGFVVCWAPITIFHSYYTIHGSFLWDEITSFTCGITRNWFIARFMAHLNCALNPCICFIFSGNYRQGLRSLCCLC